MKRCVIPTRYCRRVPDPNWNSPGERIEHFLITVRAKDLPELPTDPNPRAQKTSKPLYKEVTKSLLDQNDPSFHLKNKGITMIARDAKYDEKTESVEVLFEEGQGIVDGAHTYRIIRDNQMECPDVQYVKLEILVGVSNDMVESIAQGLNTSVQVSEMSLANLGSRFDWIKEELKSMPYASQIAYRENEEGPYDARDLMALLTLFNVSEFKDGSSHPIIAYRNKAECLERFKKDSEVSGDGSSYRKLRPLLKDILDLHDYIHLHGKALYNEATGGKGGNLSWMDRRKRGQHSLIFSGAKTEDKLVDGALYPMLGAFRYLVQQKKSERVYSWKVGSFDRVKELFNVVGGDMMQATQQTSVISGRNPSVIGKNQGHWDNLYKTVAIAYLEKFKS